MTRSFWSPPAAATHPPLERDIDTDVVVVGAGITGLTAAVRLARAGRRVTVLEAHRIASGTTGSTSAHLTVETDTDLDELVGRVGRDRAFAVVRGGRAAIEHIAAFDQELGGKGAFRRVPGYLWAADEDDAERFPAVAQLYAEAGERVEACEVPLPGLEARALQLHDQALFDPVAYTVGLAELAIAAGAVLHEGSEVTEVASGKVRVGDRAVRAEHVVLATHTPPGLVPSVQARMAPMMSHLVVLRPDRPLPDALFWDTADPYHYLRPLPGGRVLVGGEDTSPGQADPRAALDRLAAWAIHRLGGAVERGWSHLFFEPADGIPFVGRLPLRGDVWVATGFSGTGLTWGTWAAEAITAGILGQPHEALTWCSPARLELGSVDRLIRDQAEVAWHLVVDRLAPDGDAHPDDLAPGEGRTMTIDGHQVAAYRDDAGVLHALSPSCTHMGCIVGWNALDKTWDCPCHGGRFAADGTRIYGPPTKSLATRRLG